MSLNACCNDLSCMLGILHSTHIVLELNTLKCRVIWTHQRSHRVRPGGMLASARKSMDPLGSDARLPKRFLSAVPVCAGAVMNPVVLLEIRSWIGCDSHRSK